MPQCYGILVYIWKFLAKAKIHHHGINLVKWNNSTETEKCWSDVMKFNDTSGQNYIFCDFLCEMRALIIANSDTDEYRIQLIECNELH